MPELPEVETVRQGLMPAMVGQKIITVKANRPNLRFAFPDNFEARLNGHYIERLDRRSKYLLARISSGETLLMHLGMSGRFTISDGKKGQKCSGRFFYSPPTNPQHDHVVFKLTDTITLTYNDPRRFGFMDLFQTDTQSENKYLKNLGPEPNTNEFSSAYLRDTFKARRSPVKSGLLDQSIVAGLGNIYVCEALWRAKIAPYRACKDINSQAIEALTRSVRCVIDEAIQAGGSTLKDFAAANGEMGYFQHDFDVYGRQGEPCHRCRDVKIERIVQSGRSSFYCEQCQQ